MKEKSNERKWKIEEDRELLDNLRTMTTFIRTIDWCYVMIYYDLMLFQDYITFSWQLLNKLILILYSEIR